MNLFNILGCATLALGAALWIAGGHAVRRRCKRRMGEEPLAFDGENKKIPFRDLNGSERRELYFYAVMALSLMFCGMWAAGL